MCTTSTVPDEKSRSTRCSKMKRRTRSTYSIRLRLLRFSRRPETRPTIVMCTSLKGYLVSDFHPRCVFILQEKRETVTSGIILLAFFQVSINNDGCFSFIRSYFFMFCSKEKSFLYVIFQIDFYCLLLYYISHIVFDDYTWFHSSSNKDFIKILSSYIFFPLLLRFSK